MKEDGKREKGHLQEAGEVDGEVGPGRGRLGQLALARLHMVESRVHGESPVHLARLTVLLDGDRAVLCCVVAPYLAEGS